MHLIKARLLANASLNEYIAPEIRASSTSSEWGALGQAEIYVSYGEYTRALQSMKHSGISFFTQPMSQVPDIYWHLLFPQPYWTELVAKRWIQWGTRSISCSLADPAGIRVQQPAL